MCAFFFGLVEDGGMKKVLEPGEAPTAVVSELLRREDERRRERQRLREVVLAALQEPACL
jgi:hypothetical protein